MSTSEVVDARKNRIDEEAAWTLLKTANSVTVAKGKKVQTFTTSNAEKKALLQQAIGPSGNLRAPTYRIRDQFVIGFNADLYQDTMNYPAASYGVSIGDKSFISSQQAAGNKTHLLIKNLTDCFELSNL